MCHAVVVSPTTVMVLFLMSLRSWPLTVLLPSYACVAVFFWSVGRQVAVDIGANQVGDIATVALLEETDQLLGKNHLFKRSLLLIKVNITTKKHNGSHYE